MPTAEGSLGSKGSRSQFRGVFPRPRRLVFVTGGVAMMLSALFLMTAGLWIGESWAIMALCVNLSVALTGAVLLKEGKDPLESSGDLFAGLLVVMVGSVWLALCFAILGSVCITKIGGAGPMVLGWVLNALALWAVVLPVISFAERVKIQPSSR